MSDNGLPTPEVYGSLVSCRICPELKMELFNKLIKSATLNENSDERQDQENFPYQAGSNSL